MAITKGELKTGLFLFYGKSEFINLTFFNGCNMEYAILF